MRPSVKAYQGFTHSPAMIKEIMAAVSIPVMAKGRIGHIVEYANLHDIVRLRSAC